MKSKLIASAFLLVTILGRAQSSKYNWGSQPRPLSKVDSAFLVDIEKKMWAIEKEKNVFRMYDGFGGGDGYNVVMTKSEMKERLSDTAIAKVQFCRFAELLSLWSRNADTAWIVGFQPMLRAQQETDYYRSQEVQLPTACYVHIPLFTYRNFIEDKEFQRLSSITLRSFAGAMYAEMKGDTLFRFISFGSASYDMYDEPYDYLPQADFVYMSQLMNNAMFSGKLSAYFDPELTQRESKKDMEQYFIPQWDSTNQIEDPNNPGTYILAPIKMETFPGGIVIYEKWIPTLCPEMKQDDKRNNQPQPYMRYVRQVLSYGMLIGYKRAIWTSPAEFDAFFHAPEFDRVPYEESFRAERFLRMHIALQP